jgi:hypothetical protein
MKKRTLMILTLTVCICCIAALSACTKQNTGDASSAGTTLAGNSEPETNAEQGTSQGSSTGASQQGTSGQTSATTAPAGQIQPTSSQNTTAQTTSAAVKPQYEWLSIGGNAYDGYVYVLKLSGPYTGATGELGAGDSLAKDCYILGNRASSTVSAEFQNYLKACPSITVTALGADKCKIETKDGFGMPAFIQVCYPGVTSDIISGYNGYLLMVDTQEQN